MYEEILYARRSHSSPAENAYSLFHHVFVLVITLSLYLYIFQHFENHRNLINFSPPLLTASGSIIRTARCMVSWDGTLFLIRYTI